MTHLLDLVLLHERGHGGRREDESGAKRVVQQRPRRRGEGVATQRVQERAADQRHCQRAAHREPSASKMIQA